MRKVSRGTGFRGVLDYAFDRDASAESPGKLVGGNMSGMCPRALASEFGVVRRLRSDIEKPVWHQALRLPAGERIAPETWEVICDRYMTLMGFTDAHQRVYVEHPDKDGQHAHIIASRIGIDGTVFLGRNENLVSTRVVAQLEEEFGLKITKSADLDLATGKTSMPDKKVPTKGEIEKTVRTGQEPPRQKLQRLVDTAKTGQPNAVQFCERLELAGVEVRANIASTSKLSGFSFSMDGVAFKASQLGDRYKLSRLLEEVMYDEIRDSAGLKRFCGAARNGADSFANAGANQISAPANVRVTSIPQGGGQADNLIAAASARVGNTSSSASIRQHNKEMETDHSKLKIAGRSIGNCTAKKIDWLDFSINDSTYYFKDKAGSRIPMVKEVEEGLLMMGRVAPSKCRAMLDIVQLNAWNHAVVSGGDKDFQQTVLDEAIKRNPLPNLRFTNTEIELKYQAHIRVVSSVPNPAFRLSHAASLMRPDNHMIR